MNDELQEEWNEGYAEGYKNGWHEALRRVREYLKQQEQENE